MSPMGLRVTLIMTSAPCDMWLVELCANIVYRVVDVCGLQPYVLLHNHQPSCQYYIRYTLGPAGRYDWTIRARQWCRFYVRLLWPLFIFMLPVIICWVWLHWLSCSEQPCKTDADVVRALEAKRLSIGSSYLRKDDWFRLFLHTGLGYGCALCSMSSL